MQDSRELLDQARAALVALAGKPPDAVLDRDVCQTLCALRDVLAALGPVVDRLAEGLDRPERFAAVDGPFAPDAREAAETARMWLRRTGFLLAAGTARPMDNALIAAGGLITCPGGGTRERRCSRL
ncbi:hypothetical protein [Sciscionella sediminilitoris]|uniref:hypothetical protein n=1 Tax=Sciscionella sediminilitoris TaxID=1445613 RepID=UPI0004DF1970|nr:hypothetical protein [Sciscionella sp. SE31]